jgi:hypothetical protein
LAADVASIDDDGQDVQVGSALAVAVFGAMVSHRFWSDAPAC